jgi:hypothetical protein
VRPMATTRPARPHASTVRTRFATFRAYRHAR